MNLLENPFHILGASLRDDRRRILELAEERSLSVDPAVCTQARADLTHPRNRLAAELAWLPGMEPGHASEALESVRHTPSALRSMQGLPALTKANLLAAALAGAEGTRQDSDLSADILELAALLEACDAEKVRTLINEERAVSGFPEVRETSVVEEGLAERRRHYRTALKSALDMLPPVALVGVVTHVVAEATARGTRNAPALIDDLIDTYEVEAQRFLDAEAHNVELLVEAVRKVVAEKRPPQILKRLLSRIEDVVSNWDMVAQPIQLSSMSRGLDHELSHRVAVPVRSLAVELFNEYGLLEESKFLTALLRDAFEEVPRVAEVTSSDAETLDGIAQKREAARREWERDITYDALVGSSYYPQRLKIAPSGIEWKGVLWPLESITRIRWGGVMDQSNGRAEFTIIIGNESSSTDIKTYSQPVYSTITDKLWRAVGPRLVVELLHRLRKGESVTFGDSLVDDRGIALRLQDEYRWTTDYVHASWHEVHFESANGSLLIRHSRNRWTHVDLPYLAVDNAHVLELALHNLREAGHRRLSDLLQG